MSTLTSGRIRQLRLASLVAGVVATALISPRADGSVIKPKVEQKIVSYSTTGTLGTAGGTSVEYLNFVGVSTSAPTAEPGGMVYMPGVFSLGGFQTTAVPEGMSVGFDSFPFSISLNLFGGPMSGEVTSQILINGMLDGELSSKPGTGLLASITSVTQVGTPIGVPPFTVADLQIMAPQFILPAGSSTSTSTSIYGYVDAQVPEPTALATLGLGIVALVVHRRRRAAIRTVGKRAA